MLLRQYNVFDRYYKTVGIPSADQHDYRTAASSDCCPGLRPVRRQALVALWLRLCGCSLLKSRLELAAATAKV